MKIHIPLTSTHLAGRNVGYELFRRYVQPHFRPKERLVITFKPQPVQISTSFVQGFTEVLADNWGKDYVRKYLKIKGAPEFKQKFWDRFY